MVDDKIWIIALDTFWAEVDGKRKEHKQGRRYKFPLVRAAEFARRGLIELVRPEAADDGDN